MNEDAYRVLRDEVQYRAGRKLRVWTSGGYLVGSVVSLDRSLLLLECYVDGDRASRTVSVVVDSISAWA